MATWTDVTSFSRGDVDRTPRSWECKLAAFRVCVTRHRGYDPSQWILLWDGNHYPLRSKDIDDAKAEALEIVRNKLQAAIDAIGKAAES